MQNNIDPDNHDLFSTIEQRTLNTVTGGGVTASQADLRSALGGDNAKLLELIAQMQASGIRPPTK